jgi:hypothetical protein
MSSNTTKSTINLDTASRLDIICRRGDTFYLVLDFGTTTIPSSGWKMEVRESDTDNEAGTAVLTIFDNEIDLVGSKLTIQKTATAMDIPSGLYVYDLESSDTTVKTYLYGTFKVNEDVTIPS